MHLNWFSFFSVFRGRLFSGELPRPWCLHLLAILVVHAKRMFERTSFTMWRYLLSVVSLHLHFWLWIEYHPISKIEASADAWVCANCCGNQTLPHFLLKYVLMFFTSITKKNSNAKTNGRKAVANLGLKTWVGTKWVWSVSMRVARFLRSKNIIW